MTHRLLSTFLSALAILPGCVPGGEDPAQGELGVEPGPHGPSVRFNPLTLPVAEVPFPNDLSLTRSGLNDNGRAWNLAVQQPSEHRTELREKLNGLDGFGPYAPIFVSFDGPLDLTTVSERSILVVNIEPGDPREGEIAALDLGQGYFPLENSNGSYWGQDPDGDLPDLMLGRENVVDLDGDGEAERVTHYEVETNTLIIRPASGPSLASAIVSDSIEHSGCSSTMRLSASSNASLVNISPLTR